MVFTLNCFNDLGKCSYGTLRESFDTEKDEIYLEDEKVDITCIEDLFPFLWRSAGMAYYDNKTHKSVARFYGTTPWWHHRYKESVDEYEKDIKNYRKKIEKGGKKESTVERWKKNLEWMEKHRNSLMDMIERLDSELEEQKKKLIEENRK